MRELKFNKGHCNAETERKAEIAARGATVPAKGHQAKISGYDELKSKGEIAKEAALIEDNTDETGNAKAHKEAAEKGGIDIAEDIIGEVEGGIARRGIVTKGQMARGEERTVKYEGQLPGKTRDREKQDGSEGETDGGRT